VLAEERCLLQIQKTPKIRRQRRRRPCQLNSYCYSRSTLPVITSGRRQPIVINKTQWRMRNFRYRWVRRLFFTWCLIFQAVVDKYQRRTRTKKLLYSPFMLNSIPLVAASLKRGPVGAVANGTRKAPNHRQSLISRPVRAFDRIPFWGQIYALNNRFCWARQVECVSSENRPLLNT